MTGRGKSPTKAHFKLGDVLSVIKAARKNRGFVTEGATGMCEHGHGKKAKFSKRKMYSNLPKNKTEL